MADAPRVHIHTTVGDLARSRAFGAGFLGVAPVKAKPGDVKFLPPFGPPHLALSDGRRTAACGQVDHTGIPVESRAIVARGLARIKAAGRAVRAEFGVDGCHAEQARFWVRDPDGIAWEVTVPNRALEEAPRAQRAKGVSCGAPS